MLRAIGLEHETKIADRAAELERVRFHFRFHFRMHPGDVLPQAIVTGTAFEALKTLYTIGNFAASTSDSCATCFCTGTLAKVLVTPVTQTR